MSNPFRYGGLVTGKDFADRDSELAELLKEVRHGSNVLLFSSRRMGKSSLLAEFMRRHAGEFLFVYVDLYGVTSKTRMAEVLMTALVKSVYGTVRRIAAGVKEILRGSRLRLVVNETGEPGIEFSVGDPTIPEIQELLEIPERIAKDRKERIVIIFDEFQEIFLLDGVPLLKAMRSRMQTHKHVSYIFAGSKKDLLLGIFEEPGGAFFKSATPIELGPIPEDQFAGFLIDRFAADGGRLDRETASALLKVSGGNTYYVQQLAHELFEVSPRPRYPHDLDVAIATVLEHESPAFNFIWDSIKSRIQKRYLAAVAEDGGVSSRTELVERYGLKSLSHVQRVVGQLDSRGITEKGRIVDPMFSQWLRRLRGRRQ